MNIGAGIGIGFAEPRGVLAFEYEQSSGCQNDSDITPVINTPGGTFSSSPTGLSINSSTGVISYQDFCNAWEDENRCGYEQSVPECFTHYYNSNGATKNLVKTTKLDLATLNDVLVFNS